MSDGIHSRIMLYDAGACPGSFASLSDQETMSRSKGRTRGEFIVSTIMPPIVRLLTRAVFCTATSPFQQGRPA